MQMWFGVAQWKKSGDINDSAKQKENIENKADDKKTPEVSVFDNANQEGNIKQQDLQEDYMGADTDSDGIPDYLEKLIGTDPQKSEDLICREIGCGSTATAKIRTLNTLIALDVSGSMGETIQGKTKLDIAKEVLNKIVETIEVNQNLGLMVYGHKDANNIQDKQLSCDSSELLIAIEKVDAAKMREALTNLTPTGWTAIGGSLDKAAQILAKYDSNEYLNQIIVITDGVETCGTDPKAVANRLIKSGIAARVDVIGFNVTNDESLVLKDIAEFGNGIYHTAYTSDGLFEYTKQMRTATQAYLKAATCDAITSINYTNCMGKTYNKAYSYIKAENGFSDFDKAYELGSSILSKRDLLIDAFNAENKAQREANWDKHLEYSRKLEVNKK